MKIPFFYRTRNEYCKVFDYVEMINLGLRKSPGFKNTKLLNIYTRYLCDEKKRWDTKVPKERVGDKKYIGIIVGNKHRMKVCDVQPTDFLQGTGIELVPSVDGKTKYDGEKTTHPTILRTHAEFKTITSVFNKRYGHGGWRLVAPRGLQQILKKIESVPNTIPAPFTFAFSDLDTEQYKERYPGGVPVTIVVNEPQANISKQLFKVVLKG